MWHYTSTEVANPDETCDTNTSTMVATPDDQTQQKQLPRYNKACGNTHPLRWPIQTNL